MRSVTSIAMTLICNGNLKNFESVLKTMPVYLETMRLCLILNHMIVYAIIMFCITCLKMFDVFFIMLFVYISKHLKTMK